MLNYIWAALIVSSLVFALATDIQDIRQDTFRNQVPLPVELAFPEGYDPDARRVPVRIQVDPRAYQEFYGTEETPAESYEGYLRQTREGTVLRFDADAELPEPLATIQGVSQSRDEELQGALVDFSGPAGQPAAEGPTEASEGVAGASEEVSPAAPLPSTRAAVRFDRVRFVKMNAIAAAALDFAETAAEIALSLIGVLALFLGLLKIGEEAGLIHSLVRLVRPILKPLFPDVPEDHPALGMIALNMTANIFGLGNAATPFGIKAMEELQELNPSDDTATDPMVMLLAINTASVQLVPPVLLLALLGLQINQLIFAIIITTALSLIIAIVATKLYGKLPGVRASDPNRIAREEGGV
jgi:spore maturation protein A